MEYSPYISDDEPGIGAEEYLDRDYEAEFLSMSGETPLPYAASETSEPATSALGRAGGLVQVLCNPGFESTVREGILGRLDLVSLSRLSRLSKALHLLFEATDRSPWIPALCRSMALAPGCLRGLGLPVSTEVEILKGLVCFLSRQRDQDGYPYPPSLAAHQTELKMWDALCLNNAMRLRVQRICKEKNAMPSRFASASLNLPSLASLEARPKTTFSFLDSARLLDDIGPERPVTLLIVRPKRHPLFIQSQLLRLLPFERFLLENDLVQSISLGNCTFSSIVGWPRRMSRVLTLSAITNDSQGHVWDWGDFPSMPALEVLKLPECVESFVGFPASMRQLKRLHTDHCARVTSLMGLPASFWCLETFNIPPNVTNLFGFPPNVPLLTSLLMRHVKQLTNLQGLPIMMGSLEKITLPSSLTSMGGFPGITNWIQCLDMSVCTEMHDMSGWPRTFSGRISKLIFPPGLKNLHGFPPVVSNIECFGFLKCTKIKSFRNFPKQLSDLKRLELPPSITPKLLNCISFSGLPELETIAVDAKTATNEYVQGVIDAVRQFHPGLIVIYQE
ncbi:uncharacterized protein BJ171DRAFT_508299 [Polychytrium aggregatum]|uniref:uncharacterized protein n=1 Tax=Polychytrium aggregatum TaxID=110093 RepID=UPI0022FEB3E2|nr:uncharacterized protein BJ171DRAFT_508299 [Polychytrium aggregatum]KAI9203843.1 hypothetical protein BJ171DRAFT_508299 [Polychytrium aggregatum]